MKSAQWPAEHGYQLSVYSTIRKTVENLYQVSIKFRYIMHNFTATSKETRPATTT
jgi:hypothetical protein